MALELLLLFLCLHPYVTLIIYARQHICHIIIFFFLNVYFFFALNFIAIIQEAYKPPYNCKSYTIHPLYGDLGTAKKLMQQRSDSLASLLVLRHQVSPLGTEGAAGYCSWPPKRHSGDRIKRQQLLQAIWKQRQCPLYHHSLHDDAYIRDQTFIFY